MRFQEYAKMNDNHTMNIAYSLNRDCLPYLLISMYSLLTAGKGERNLRILLLVDQDLTREDLSPLFRMVSRFPGCTLEAKWPLSLTARRFVSDESCCLNPKAVQVAYFRLFLPELFDGEARCLYLDDDLVITKPLSNLFHFMGRNKPWAVQGVPYEDYWYDAEKRFKAQEDL